MKRRDAMGLLMLGAGGAAWGQAYPSRPIRLIAPFTAGGGTDMIARSLAERIGASMGQPVVVDNRSGGIGVIGTDLTAKSPPDGYTIMIATPTFTVNPSMMSRLPYDIIRDFAPVSLVARSPHLLAINPKLPVSTVAELVAYGKSNPLSFSSSGSGASSHLAAELFSSLTGVKMTHVPYRGTGDAALAVVTGTVSLAFLDTQTLLPLIKGGRLRGLAVTGPQRSPAAPELPTMVELGYSRFLSGVWYGIVAPAHTPPDVIARLNAEIVKAVRGPELQSILRREAAEPVGSSAAEFGELIKAELQRWGTVIREAGIPPTN